MTTFSEYENAALGTAARFYFGEDGRTALRTAALGLLSEAGEIASAIKKCDERGTPLDYANIKEEVGDVLWYCVLISWLLCTDLDTIAEANLVKLAARHGKGGMATPVVPRPES